MIAAYRETVTLTLDEFQTRGLVEQGRCPERRGRLSLSGVVPIASAVPGDVSAPASTTP